ncbi:MAG TPA: RnfABCDGE type electron transport complex subunit G [Tissierellia bacterium]|jgi:electron transport complex protein RnfG|nr:RnfABCDGE type electron transport complex subunit G [Tissierellia bacterium]
MKDIMKMGLILMVFCLLSALALSMTYGSTIDVITQSRAAADIANRKEVMGEADDFAPIDEGLLEQFQREDPNIKDVHQALKGGNVIGHVVKVSSQGFGGPIEIVVGFDTDFQVTGLRLGTHTETPGLGANAAKPEFYEQFEGMTLTRDIAVDKVQAGDNQVQAVTAATVTSAAVTNGVNRIGKILERLVNP